MNVLLVILQIIGAYLLVDAVAGLYHLFTDMGYNIPSQVSFFRKHHEQPETMTFDLQPMMMGVPLIILSFFYFVPFILACGLFFCVAQIPHYYIHHPENTPRMITWLQKLKLIVSEDSHMEHHYGNGKFDKNFCVFTGWNDWWINMLAKRLIK